MLRSYGAKHERKSQYANLSAYPRSAFTARRRPRRRRLSSNDQKPQALPQTLPTDAASPCCTTTGSLQRVYGLSLRYKRTRKRMNYSERRGQFPRMCFRIRPQAAGDAVRYAPRVCTLVLFICSLSSSVYRRLSWLGSLMSG